MIKFILGLLLAANLIGCKPIEEIPEPKKVVESPIVWSKSISARSASGLNSAPVYFEEIAIVGKKEQIGYTVFAKDAINGDSIWETTIQAHGAFNPLDGNGTILYQDKLVFSDGLEIFVLEAETGCLLWQVKTQGFRGGSCVIDGYVYKSDYINRTTSTMYKFDINTGAKQALFTIKHGKDEPGGDFTPNLLMPVKWIHPSGDEILVLQNRSYGYDKIGHDGNYGYSKMDLMAYNVTADSILWYRYEVDNFSSMARPTIDGDKVYFFGGQTVYCVHAGSGETLWEYSIGTGSDDNFFTANVLLHGDKLIAKPNNSTMHALDKNTGALIWKNTNLMSMPSMLNVKDNVIWYAGGGIWAIDANTGKTIIEGHKGTSGSWIFPIAHHPTNGHIYTSDGWTFYCLDPKKFIK